MPRFIETIMKEEFDSNVVFSQNVSEFVTVAGEYCLFVENALRFKKKDFLDKTRKILPLLYLKGSLLPRLESIYDEGNEKFVTEEDWDFIQQSVRKKLGYHDEYTDIYDSLTHEQLDPSTASISDNLADIYQDLKNFITLYNIGTEEIMNDALWECQLNFEEFWGQKLVSALKAIHAVYFGGDDLSDDDDRDNPDDDEPDTSNWIISKRQNDFRSEE